MHTLDIQVSHSSCMNIKTYLFFFLTFCSIITSISGIINHYCIIENKKKLGENKKKLRTIYPKNHENFKNSKPKVQFYWFLYKNVHLENLRDHKIGMLATKGLRYFYLKYRSYQKFRNLNLLLFKE